MLVEAMVDVIE